MSSPQGVASQQSEQLPFFKDYYSSDEIHPGDKVATLWAYQPRAGDEFSLERGDMLKVVGIWDDGMGNRSVDERECRGLGKRKKQAQRDSGVSHTSGSSPNISGEIKAFPLVCVCLPTIGGRPLREMDRQRQLQPPRTVDNELDSHYFAFSFPRLMKVFSNFYHYIRSQRVSNALTTHWHIASQPHTIRPYLRTSSDDHARS